MRCCWKTRLCLSCVWNKMLKGTRCQIPGSFLKLPVFYVWPGVVSVDGSKEYVEFVIYTLGVIQPTHSSVQQIVCEPLVFARSCVTLKSLQYLHRGAEEIAINSYDFPRKLSTAATDSFTACSALPSSQGATLLKDDYWFWCP